MLALAVLLIVVMTLFAVHLGVLIGQEILKPPKWLIPKQGLLEILGYFLLVLIGVELLETLKLYGKKDVIHVRVVLEVALIAMARKVIIEEPDAVPSLTPFRNCGADSCFRYCVFFSSARRNEKQDMESCNAQTGHKRCCCQQRSSAR